MTDDFRKRVAAICSNLPGSELTDPWGGGHEVWKVGGKMYASIGAVTPGVAVKCADVDTAELLREAGVGTKAPYMHASWILLPDSIDDGELAGRIKHSYTLIRDKLPVAVRRALTGEGS